MSLFPAYSKEDDVQIQDEKIVPETLSKDPESKWLENSSFIPAPVVEISTSSSEVEILSEPEAERKKNDEPKRKKKKKRRKNEPPVTKTQNKAEENDNICFKDNFRNEMFLTLDTIKNMRPKYTTSTSYKLGLFMHSYGQKRKKSRYFHKNLDAKEYFEKKIIKKSVLTKGNQESLNEEEQDFMNKQRELAEEQRLKTEKFSKKLAENPEDSELWLSYANFQDEIAASSRFSADGDTLKHNTNQKKLTIIQRGLFANPHSSELLKMKLSLLSQLHPTDEFVNQVEAMIHRDQKNLILWDMLIMSVKTSCAICTVSKVLDIYTKFFKILKQTTKSDRRFYDEQVIKSLFRCLTFLRHAGLWEQMWEIIRINLCINFDLDPNTLKDTKTIDEKTLINLEEIVLKSKLPLNQLWLRVECLRESSYWTGVNTESVDLELVADAKRLVSSEDTAEFVYPLLTQESNFLLSIMSIFLLKVPLLPTRHCVLKRLGLENDNWSVETLEFILPMIKFIDLEGTPFVQQLLEGELTSGPQVLKFHPTQEVFMDFVRSVFQMVAESLTDRQRTGIYVWWMKFERLLVKVVKHDPLGDKGRNKKLKQLIKDFMKNPKNRSNIYFYREYALIENEFGNQNACIRILETIIGSQSKEKHAVISLYRTIFDLLFKSENEAVVMDKVIETTKSFQKFLVSPHNREKTIHEILLDEINLFLENPIEADESEESVFLPHVYCDILACYSYIKYAERCSNFVDSILLLYDKCITHLESAPSLRERFFEEKINFLQFFRRKGYDNQVILEESLNEALKEYPSNFCLVSIKAVMVSELPFWKLKLRREKQNVWSALATCLALKRRICHFKKIDDRDSAEAMLNKLVSYHQILAETENLQKCPMIWRLLMLWLREFGLCEKKGEEVYYEAVAQCPWARGVYINAAEVAPQILSQIQDLIKEKELRIHVTPEELDILRG